jgi:hypothetical protein
MQFFQKAPIYRRLSLLGSRKYLLIAESKLNRNQQVGNMSVLTAKVGGYSPHKPGDADAKPLSLQTIFTRLGSHFHPFAGGTPMTSALSRKVVRAFKQPATFTTAFEPVKLEMARKM